MKTISNIVVAAITSLALAGCISNDLPYPQIQANFRSLEVAGQDAGTAIDSAACTVKLTLAESTNIYAVEVDSYTLTEGASVVGDVLEAPLDLSSPVQVILHLYQDYLWTIRAQQQIERYFDVEGQMGETTIDVPGRRVLVQVRADVDLSRLHVVRAKLANAGSTMSPDISSGGYIDATGPAEIAVDVFGHRQLWTVYVEQVDVAVRTISVDSWTCVAWVNGQAEAGKENGAEYRLSGTEEWTRVPQQNVTHNAGAFTARIDHLSPGTAYEARTYSGTDLGNIVEFTTGKAEQLPNSDFDQWWLDGKIWCPWAENGTPFWGTGNKGAVTLGPSNTTPTDQTPSGPGWAAQLETKFVGIGIIGKLAAGNLFVGSYVRTEGTNGVLSFGRPFSQRPTHMSGMYRYHGVPISHSDNDHKYLIGRPDTCIIWVALIDSDEPLEIRTNPSNRQLFNPEAPEVVAYGCMKQADEVAQYVPFQFELKYKSTSRVPKYILVTASASMYGDFFTGGAGSVLCIDDFLLEYDY